MDSTYTGREERVGLDVSTTQLDGLIELTLLLDLVTLALALALALALSLAGISLTDISFAGLFTSGLAAYSSIITPGSTAAAAGMSHASTNPSISSANTVVAHNDNIPGRSSTAMGKSRRGGCEELGDKQSSMEELHGNGSQYLSTLVRTELKEWSRI